MRARSLRRSSMIAVGLSVVAGAAGLAGASPAQAFPDCRVIDCQVPVHVEKPLLKWPGPVCLSCPVDFRDFLAEIVLPEIDVLRPIDIAAFPGR